MPNNYDDIKEIPGYPKIPLGRAENLSGKKFYEWTVLYRTNNIGKASAWVCQCSCGAYSAVSATSLKSGASKRCRECANKKNIADISGQRFGKLIAIEPTDRRSYNSVIWKCQCDCGNITYVSNDHLKKGEILSCGCLQKERASNANFKDITGLRSGKLVAIAPINKGSGDGHVIWKCKCDCGNISYVDSTRLISQTVQSCGCIKSKGELKIINILQENNIYFESQKTFSSCLFNKEDKKSLAKFDFFINNNYLIEYDGIQHFSNIRGNWNSSETLKIRQQRDEYKNQWCKENNIPLIRIPYWHYDDLCLEDLLLETTQFRVV